MAAHDDDVVYDLVLTFDPETSLMDVTGYSNGISRDDIFALMRRAAASLLSATPEHAARRFLEEGMNYTKPFPIRHRATTENDEITVVMEAVDHDPDFNMKAAIYRTLSACRAYRLGLGSVSEPQTGSAASCAAEPAAPGLPSTRVGSAQP